MAEENVARFIASFAARCGRAASHSTVRGSPVCGVEPSARDLKIWLPTLDAIRTLLAGRAGRSNQRKTGLQSGFRTFTFNSSELGAYFLKIPETFCQVDTEHAGPRVSLSKVGLHIDILALESDIATKLGPSLVASHTTSRDNYLETHRTPVRCCAELPCDATPGDSARGSAALGTETGR